VCSLVHTYYATSLSFTVSKIDPKSVAMFLLALQIVLDLFVMSVHHKIQDE
jgi:hypothetical protein